MTSQVSTEPQSGTSDFDDEIEPNCTGQQSGKGIQGKPIDLNPCLHVLQISEHLILRYNY
jgi:hypothetical protein